MLDEIRKRRKKVVGLRMF